VNRYVLTPAAEDDLLRIFDHLEGENPTAVLRVVDAIEEALQLLADSPNLGHVRLD
jgi:plasmid stabilization system protein ParE